MHYFNRETLDAGAAETEADAEAPTDAEASMEAVTVMTGAFRHRCQIGREGDRVLTRIITEGQEASGLWVTINDSQSHSTVDEFITNLNITAEDLVRAYGLDVS